MLQNLFKKLSFKCLGPFSSKIILNYYMNQTDLEIFFLVAKM